MSYSFICQMPLLYLHDYTTQQEDDMDMMQILIQRDKEQEAKRAEINKQTFSDSYNEEAETYEVETDIEFGE